MDMNGIVLVDKPAGISSFGVVARVRRILSQAAGKKVKVGHTGTLDPFATGLMIVVVGEYCKRAGEFSKLDKSYVAAARLGQTSSTGDPEGEISQISDKEPSEQAVRDTLQAFTGRITQTPPSYSAIKVNGVRAYKLARAGQEVDMPTREVTVYDIRLESYDYPMIVLEARVSSGTYIRTLVQDIGEKLGTGAYTAALRRTEVGKYSVENAIVLRDDMTADEIPIAHI